MKINILGAFLLCILSFSELVAQDYAAMVRPEGSKEWGYADETGKMMIKPQYRTCYPFSTAGYAIIEEKKQFVFIDKNNKRLDLGLKKFELKEFSFGFGLGGLLNFSEGLVPVREKKLYGYYNTDGKLAIEMKYENVSGFSDGHAFAILKGKYYILDKNGKESAVETNDIVEIKRPSEGMVGYRAKNKDMGFVDATGKVVVEAKFEAIGIFKDGLAWAKDKNDKVGFIDKTGAWVIEPQFLAAKNFDPACGIARVKSDDGWGYVNKKGAAVKLEITTEVWGDFVEGLAKGRVDGKLGFFGPDGKWVIKPQYDAVGKVSNGFIAVRVEKLWGYIDTTGKMVIQPQFDAVKPMMKMN